MAETETQTEATDIAALRSTLAALRAELADFTYTVSHDLRADLRHILAFAQIVQEDAGPQLDAQAQSHLATITQSARHMGVLMDGLMELSRLGSVPLTACPVDLGVLVAEVCLTLQAVPLQRVVAWRIAPEFPVVQGDAALLRQALQQLLGNALKFTSPRAVAEIEVGWESAAEVVADSAAESVVIFVRDNGVGFSPALQAKLFHVFQRLHSPREFDGVGMGLAMTRKIVERHGGRVAAQGQPDGGCCMRITLPLA